VECGLWDWAEVQGDCEERDESGGRKQNGEFFGKLLFRFYCSGNFVHPSDFLTLDKPK